MKSVVFLLSVGMSPVLVTDPGLADGDHERARMLFQSGEILPLEQILKLVRKHHSGHLLEAELERENGRYVYEIELLSPDGEVWELQLDAVSGELLETEEEEEE